MQFTQYLVIETFIKSGELPTGRIIEVDGYALSSPF